MIDQDAEEPAVEPDGWPTGNEPPLSAQERELWQKRREMDRLREYLAYPRWRSEQAAWILVGIAPEETMGGPGDWGFAWLPGGLRDNWRSGDGSIDPFRLEQHVMMELEDVRGFVSGDSRRPKEWIEHASVRAYEPPWLKAAQNDALCQPYLPSFADPAAMQDSASKIPSLGGLAKADNNLAKLLVVHRWDQWQRGEEYFTSDAHFIREMNVDYFYTEKPADDRPFVTGPRTIGGWVRDLKRERDEGHTEAWIKRARAAFGEKYPTYNSSSEPSQGRSK